MAFVLGLTGTFGSGKTTVAGLMREQGARVIDADELAREVVEPGRPAYEAVVREFGREVLGEDGRLDRKVLAERVFADPERLARLNAIIHPAVRAVEMRLLEAYRASPLVVLDVPLLYEVGLDRQVDRVVVVSISERERFARLKHRGFSEREVIARLGRQMAQARKLLRADYVIDNSGPPEATRQQVTILMDQLQGEKPKER